MKNLKKLMSIALTTAMTSALTFPAMAASITIGNAVEGKTYTAYKIFDYTESAVDGEEQPIRSYTMDADTYAVWGLVVEGFTYDCNGDDTPDQVFTSTNVNDLYYFYVADDAIDDFQAIEGVDPEIAIKFSEYLRENIPENLGDSIRYSASIPDDEDGETETDNLTLESNAETGYYFVSTDVGALLMLRHVGDNVTIAEKNVLPTVSSKTVKVAGSDEYTDINSVSSGDTVEFEIKVTVNSGNNDEIIVHDKMGEGFNLDASTIKMSVGSEAAQSVTDDTEAEFYYQTEALEDPNPCDFHLVLTEDYVKSLVDDVDNVVLTITYSAKVTDEIDNDNAGINEAWTSYNGTTIPGDETKSCTATFNIEKIDGVSRIALSGAKFRLFDENKQEIKLRNVLDEDGQPTNTWIADTDASAGEAVVTPENGKVVIKNLAAGTYYLREVEAPEGYNRLTYDIPVQITAFTESDGAVSGGDIKADLDGADGEGNVEWETISNKVVTIANNRGTMLPSTGGIGTTVFYAAGIILMAGAVFFVIRTKKSA